MYYFLPSINTLFLSSKKSKMPMLDYHAKQELDSQIRSFLNVFFGALQRNETDIFNHMMPKMYPGIQDHGFVLDEYEYLILPEDVKAGVVRVTSANDLVISATDTEIVCVQKLKDKDWYYGFRVVPTKEVSTEWLRAMTLMLTYASEVLKARVREALITYQNTGYRIVPVSPIILEQNYQRIFHRAKQILD